jgi:hypothetical protein
MPAFEIVGASQSSFVRTARIACTEKGVPCEPVPAPPHMPEVDAIDPVPGRGA